MTPANEQLLRDASARAIRYLSGIDDRGVAVTSEARANLDVLSEPLPEQGLSPDSILALLDQVGSPATTATAGGRFFGFVVGGTLPVALAANWLASAWDQDAGMASICPINATLEEVSRRWLLDLFGLPPDCGVGFVTGGTMANFSALAAARHSILKQAGWDVEANGLFGAAPVTIVVSDEVHVSLIKALGLLGFGRQRVVRIPTDRQGRMRIDALPDLNGPAIVCLQAGNVNTGAFDPASELCAWAHERRAWVHVDGAFGLWAAASPSRSHLMTGFADADSWAVDAHKWLNVPYDSGIVCVRDPEALRGAMMTSAPYLEQGALREPDQFTPEMSRRARGVDIWAALRSLGRTGVADLVERCCHHATRFAEGLADAGYEILNDIVLNQVLVSFGPPETTRQVIADLQASGVCWCGGTVWQGRTAMRISVSSWATTETDVERCLAEMISIAARVTTEQRAT
jgi:glutamate/tyrosine decarboxylase-like PLP-dependent enzyme